MKFLKENKNYIKAIALALVILMCTPFLTINAIETMSGGRSMEVTTGATTSNSYVIFSRKMANIVAQHHGYTGAEAFKADYNYGSEANLAYNSTTNEIVIMVSGSVVEHTNLYGGWK